MYEHDPRRMPGSLRCAVSLLVALVACVAESTPPPLQVPPTPEVEGPPAARQARPGRTLWFADGPGRAAILAREHRDHDAAIRHLDELLGRDGLSPGDRGAALVLRALEDLEADRHAEAADRLAEARKVPELAPLGSWLSVLEAQARLDSGDPDAALGLIADVSPDGVLARDVLVVRGDARSRTEDLAGARAAYETFLARFSSGRRVHEVRAKLARVLALADEAEHVARARELYEKVVLDVPLGVYGREAERALEKLGGGPRGAEAQRRARARAFARVRALIGRGRYDEAKREATAILKPKGLSPEVRCEAEYLHGTAIFKARERAKARPAFERAARACRRVGAARVDTTVKSLYQAARGRYAEGRYTRAARAFEALAGEFADHSYADDAWVLAGESWAEAGEPQKARAAYRGALAVQGDMAGDARRRLLVMAIADARHDDALALADQALARGNLVRKQRAKLHYFRGRALDALGRREDAVSAWLESVRTLPLGYAALQSLSRLSESGDADLERGLALVRARSDRADPVAFDLPAGSASERTRLFARLGLAEQARAELEAAGIAGWPAAAVLHQAGLYAESQRIVARSDSVWRTRPPDDATLPRWSIAHPRPFLELVEARASEHGVPSLLVYSVMQTESRFDPGVTSWAGARGLMQLMPETAKSVAERAGVELGNADVLYDPATNLDLGVRYLGRLIERHGGGTRAVPLAIASYNAGAGAVERWLAERPSWDLDQFVEAIPYDETRKYTQSVLGRLWAYSWLYGGEEAVFLLPRTLTP